MKKGVIFDLDGVIVDTAPFHYLAWKETADKLWAQHPFIMKGYCNYKKKVH